MPERKISKAVVLANSTKPDFDEISSSFRSRLQSQGIGCEVISLSSTVSDLKIEVPDCDMAISLGGDGTVLTCAELLKGRGIPILAVNFGTFGYIAETPTDELWRVFEDYRSGRTDVISRMMLDVSGWAT